MRQIAEFGLAAVGIEYDHTNQAIFDEQFIALHEYLKPQSWAQSSAVAWVGYSLGAQRTLSFALRHPEFQPQLMVRMAGGLVPELEEKFKVSGLTFKVKDSENQKNTKPSTVIHCPVLFVHGEHDEVFPLNDCERLAELLRSHGTPVEMRRLPQSSHGFGNDWAAVMRGVAEYCVARLPLTDYAAVIPGCRLTPTETQRFNLAMRRAGQHRRELWRAVTTSREPERHTVMNVICGLEDYDLAHISTAQLREFVHVAWQARRKYPWCRNSPLEIFEKFTANPRIYEEPLEAPPFPFVRPSLPRVKYCHSTGEASDVVAAWLYSRLRARTAPAAPESTLRQMLKETGWCRESAMMYT